jgi:hypothetical protein
VDEDSDAVGVQESHPAEVEDQCIDARVGDRLLEDCLEPLAGHHVDVAGDGEAQRAVGTGVSFYDQVGHGVPTSCVRDAEWRPDGSGPATDPAAEVGGLLRAWLKKRTSSAEASGPSGSVCRPGAPPDQA